MRAVVPRSLYSPVFHTAANGSMEYRNGWTWRHGRGRTFPPHTASWMSRHGPPARRPASIWQSRGTSEDVATMQQSGRLVARARCPATRAWGAMQNRSAISTPCGVTLSQTQRPPRAPLSRDGLTVAAPAWMPPPGFGPSMDFPSRRGLVRWIERVAVTVPASSGQPSSGGGGNLMPPDVAQGDDAPNGVTNRRKMATASRDKSKGAPVATSSSTPPMRPCLLATESGPPYLRQARRPSERCTGGGKGPSLNPPPEAMLYPSSYVYAVVVQLVYDDEAAATFAG